MPEQHTGEAPTWLTRWLARWVAGLLRRRRLAIAVVALLALVCTAGALRLELDFSSTAFYGEHSPEAERFAAYQRDWGADDDVVLVLVRARAGEPANLLTPGRLSAIADLGASLRASPLTRGVLDVASAPLPIPRLGPGTALGATDLRQLIARSPGVPDIAPDIARDIAADTPLVPRLLSADADLSALAVELQFSSDDVLRTRAAVEDLRAIAAEHEAALAEQGLRWELAGVPAIRASFFALVIHDQLIFVPAMIALVGLALWIVFRRAHGVWIAGLGAGLPTAMLVGCMGWMGEPIGLLNQAYFTLLPVIAVADAIHVIARVREQRAADLGGPQAEREHSAPHLRGLNPSERAIVRGASRVGLACALTTLTTVAGFASLGLAHMPILRGFGLYAALGITLAFLCVVTVVPLALSFVPESASRDAPELPGSRLVQACARLAVRRPWAVLAGALALGALALIPAGRVRIDNTLSGLLAPEHPTSRASARVDAELGGVLELAFELRAVDGPYTQGEHAPVDLRAPEWIEVMAGFETWLAAAPEVRAVEGPGGLIQASAPLFKPTFKPTFKPDFKPDFEPTFKPDFRASAIPTDQADIEARLEALAPFLPEPLLGPEGARARIRAGLPDVSGRAFIAFAERAEAELRTRVQARGPGVEVHATGTPLLAYRGVNGITGDLRRSFAVVFLIVALVIGLLLRSAWATALTLLPNLLPLLFGYAAVAAVGGVLDPLAAVILTLGLGIAVDDSLHVLMRVREELRAAPAENPKKTLEAALVRAMSHAGRSVTVTSVVLAAGLALNLGASFPPMQMLGLLGAVVVGTAWLADLLLLPALIVLLEGRGLTRRGRASP